MQRYETIYFDTPGHQMYLQHHNGKLNRYKIRFRRYVDSNLGFFEIKFKNNRRRTIKERIPFDGTGETIGGSALEFLRQTAPFPAESLNPSLHISFTRTTFVNHSLSERLTLDTNLTFVHEGKEKSYPGLVVAELKQDKNAVSVFKTIMRKEHIPACSISKYCLGIISLNPTVKKNNFKPKLEIIKKITHDLS
jgi:hypothetical protein